MHPNSTFSFPLEELVQKSEEFVCCQNELKSQSVMQVSELEKQV